MLRENRSPGLISVTDLAIFTWGKKKYICFFPLAVFLCIYRCSGYSGILEKKKQTTKVETFEVPEVPKSCMKHFALKGRRWEKGEQGDNYDIKILLILFSIISLLARNPSGKKSNLAS